jgi:putative peptidoglycan lipid II flippase
MKTPARIAIAVLIITQLLNLALVPLFQHAALTLSVGLGALINATWLLIGLRQRGSYVPVPGWWKFSLQVVAASALLAVFLVWAGSALPWTRFENAKLERIGYLALVLMASAAIYFVALWATGMKLRKLLHPRVKSA